MIAENVFWGCSAAVIYHHAVFPWMLDRLARLPEQAASGSGMDKAAVRVLDSNAEDLPSVAIVMPAYNEAGYIQRKLLNLAQLDYPRDRLRVVLICDGCNDGTDLLAQQVIETPALDRLVVDLHVFNSNQGKVAQLNAFIEPVGEEIVVLTDVSALLPQDAVLRVATHMRDASVGVVCGGYRLETPGSDGEALYWEYQTRIKQAEAALASPIGAHGAFYAFRRALWTPLELDTINDDFILPMRIVARGHRAVYDPAIAARELECARPSQDFRRRIRIGAGNMQQLLRLTRLADPRRPALALLFLSGKGLRSVVPFLLLSALISSGALALSGSSFYGAATLAQLGLYALGLGKVLAPGIVMPRGINGVAYLASGQIASLIGGLRYLGGFGGRQFRRKDQPALTDSNTQDFIHPLTRFGKRMLDVVLALGAFVVLVGLFPFVALMIKLGSPGPVFYRQLRVGERTETDTRLFLLYKFRTMRTDAEAATGAVWAQVNDPRATRFGRFMRKTRIDELPQCLNVLHGDMSVVGPRPERPSFFSKLENEIPFYIERTYGLRPGITGLAQISQGYDASVEDVRAKVMHDHVYAMRLMRPLEWLVTDLTIIFRTFTVMVLGKGQ